MRILKIIIFVIIILVSFNKVFAQVDSLKQKKWSLNGYVKYMQTLSFVDIDKNWISDNLIHNRFNFRYDISKNLFFNMQVRNRIFYGEMVNIFPDYSDLINKDDGFVSMSGILFEGNSVFMHSIIDRLYFDYTYKKIQLTIGRQRVNWGRTFIWNPNDLFNSYSFFDFDYEEKPGSDAVRLQYYPTFSSKFDVVAKLNSDKKITTAGLYQFNKINTDFQVIIGYFNEEDFVVGGGFSGSLFNGGLRGEISYFRSNSNFVDTLGDVVASLAYDYTFKNSLMLQVEGLYNGFGKASGDFNLSQFYYMQLSPKSLSITEFSYVVQVSYPVNPLLNIRFSAMYNPNNNSAYFGPSFEYSLKENLELSFYSQYFTSKTASDLGGKGGFVFWRLKKSF